MSDKISNQRIMRGVFMTIAGGFLWGINGTISKVLMDYYAMSPLWLACMRELLACWFFLVAAHFTTPGKTTQALRDKRAVLNILVLAVCAILLSQVSYLESIHWTNAATATVMQSLNVVMVTLYICATHKRCPRPKELVGVALAVVGTYLIATGGHVGELMLPMSGLMWGLICALSATILAILPLKIMERWGNFTANGLAFLFSGIILAIFVQPWNNPPTLDALGIFLLAVSVIGGTFGSYALFLQGVKEVGSVRGSMLSTSEPVMATISSVLLLGASFSPGELLGFALIIIMVFITA